MKFCPNTLQEEQIVPFNQTLRSQQAADHLGLWQQSAFPGFNVREPVNPRSYHVALLRLRGAVHGDAIGWRCQLRRVRLDEATSVNETSQRDRGEERWS